MTQNNNPITGITARIAGLVGGYGRLILALILSIGGYIVASSLLAAHDAKIIMQATLSERDKAIKDRDQLEAQHQAEIATLKRQAQTPQQIVKYLPKVITLPMPPQAISLPANTGAAGAEGPPSRGRADLPDSPKPQSEIDGLYFPAPDVKPLFDRLADCQNMEQSLSICKQDLVDRSAEVKAAKQAAKGGFWMHLKQNTKWFVIGAGGGVAAICATGHCK